MEQGNMTIRTNGVLESDYILGHSDREIRRLMHQATMLRPITERLLRNAGIGRGMRVLDRSSRAVFDLTHTPISD